MFPPVKRIQHQVLNDLGVPPNVLAFVNYPTKFDSQETERALKKTDIRVPRLEGLRLATMGLLGKKS